MPDPRPLPRDLSLFFKRGCVLCTWPNLKERPSCHPFPLPQSKIKSSPGYHASTFLSRMPQYVVIGRIFTPALLLRL